MTYTRDTAFDFETENAMIEIKVPMSVAVETVSCAWKSFHEAVNQIAGYCESHDVKEKCKRIVLLQSASMGIELWAAKMKTKENGISLMSCGILQAAF